MQSIDWFALESKQAAPPFEPDSKKANFDATHELEELLLEDNPLKAKKRNPKNDINTMSNEMRFMEETFLVYDHTAMARKCKQFDCKILRETVLSNSIYHHSLVP